MFHTKYYIIVLHIPFQKYERLTISLYNIIVTNVTKFVTVCIIIVITDSLRNYTLRN
jgi:hypothetical protein